MKNPCRILSVALCLSLLAGGGCKRKQNPAVPRVESPDKPFSLLDTTAPPPPAEGPVENKPAPPPPAPSLSPVPHLDLARLAKDAGPAVILLSVFDSAGKLTATANGFFITETGRFITSARVIAGGENAIAKTADGKVYNVTGFLSVSSPLDLAVLQAEVKRVPFLSLNKTMTPAAGSLAAVIGSPLRHKIRPPMEAILSAKLFDASSEWFELPLTLDKESVGAPVLDERGEVIGIVTSTTGRAEASIVVRPATALLPLLDSISATTMPRWPGSSGPGVTPTPSPSPKKTPTPTPSPKLPSRLVFNPQPAYPMAARRSNPPIKGSGRFRINFSAAGDARSVDVVQSTGSSLLDTAALSALRLWKCAPGPEWSLSVPIT
ncbi:MAG: serine protease Do, partial [Verrucomicrobiota bacterium]